MGGPATRAAFRATERAGRGVKARGPGELSPRPAPPSPASRASGTTPPAFVALRLRATPSNPCGGPLQVFDGKQRYDLRLRYSARVTWNTDVYKGPAIRCDVEYIEIAGFDPKSAEQREADREDIRWTNITLAEINRGELTPPLKAELRSNRSGKYTYRATKLSYGRAR